MNSKERLDNFINGKEVDRRPNLTIVGSVVTQYNNIGVDVYCKDYKKMAEAATLCAKDTGLDYVQIASDLQRTAEGYGSEVEFYADKLPTVTKYALEDITDVDDLKPRKAKDIPRLYDLVKATKYVLDTVDDIYPMTICEGPVTIAGNIRGVEDFLMDLYDEPEACKKLLDLAVDTIIDFLDELAAVGAKYVYVPDPVASLLSPASYKDFVLECHKKIYAHMEKSGITGRLHMCGDTEALLPLTSTCGAKIIDIDHAVDYEKALALVEDRCILNGNIDPVEDVYSADAKHTYDAIYNLGKKINRPDALYMPGCELPTTTKIENVKAITKALEDLQ